MKQQTAVEWLKNMLESNYGDPDMLFISWKNFNEVFEQAKQMEKQQHDNTWVDSRIEDRGEGFIGREKTFEQYYNETYGQD